MQAIEWDGNILWVVWGLWYKKRFPNELHEIIPKNGEAKTLLGFYLVAILSLIRRPLITSSPRTLYGGLFPESPTLPSSDLNPPSPGCQATWIEIRFAHAIGGVFLTGIVGVLFGQWRGAFSKQPSSQLTGESSGKKYIFFLHNWQKKHFAFFLDLCRPPQSTRL